MPTRVLVWNLEHFGRKCTNVAFAEVCKAMLAGLIAKANVSVVVIQEFQKGGPTMLPDIAALLNKMPPQVGAWHYDWVKAAVDEDRYLGNPGRFVAGQVEPDDLDMEKSNSNAEAYAVLYRDDALVGQPEPLSAGADAVPAWGRYSGWASVGSAITLELWGQLGPDPDDDTEAHFVLNEWPCQRIPLPHPKTIERLTQWRIDVETAGNNTTFTKAERDALAQEAQLALQNGVFRFGGVRRPCSVNLRVGPHEVPLVVYHAPVNPDLRELTPALGTLLSLGSHALRPTAARGVLAGDLNLTRTTARQSVASLAGDLGFTLLELATPPGYPRATTGIRWYAKAGRVDQSMPRGRRYVNIGDDIYGQHIRDIAFRNDGCAVPVEAAIFDADRHLFEPTDKDCVFFQALAAYGSSVLDYFINQRTKKSKKDKEKDPEKKKRKPMTDYERLESEGHKAVTEYVDLVVNWYEAGGPGGMPKLADPSVKNTLKAWFYNTYISDHLPLVLQFG